MLPQRLSAALDVSVPESQKIIKAFKSCLLEELKEEGSIILVGLGTLRVRERGARKGHNPQTGKEIKIPARKTIVFKVSPKAKQVISEKKTGKKKG